MNGSNPNQPFIDTRTNLRDTAKWIVAILGAFIVFLVGTGSLANIGALDNGPRLWTALIAIAAVGLLAWRPFFLGLNLIASRIRSFEDMATSREFADTRQRVNSWLGPQYPTQPHPINSVRLLFVRTTVVTQQSRAGTDAEKAQANAELTELQPRVREVIELCNTEYLRLKFDELRDTLFVCLALIGVASVVFSFAANPSKATEKPVPKPYLVRIDWVTDDDAALTGAGLNQSCFSKSHPAILVLSEMEGLRAGALAVPAAISEACKPVRVVLTNEGRLVAPN